MSRKGKKPIVIPKGVEIKVEGNLVRVKGPKGELAQELMKGLELSISETEVSVELPKGGPDVRKFQGLLRTLVENMVIGTTKGFEKKLEMQGVGYRANVAGQRLNVQVGYSHPTFLEIPQGIEVNVVKDKTISITGVDKQQVGQFAANVRAKRPPEPYQGKGIRYVGEYVRRKAGKAGKK